MAPNTRTGDRRLAVLDSVLSLLLDVVVWAACAALVITFVSSSQHQEQHREPRFWPPNDQVVFYAVAVRPPGTAGLISEYVTKLGQDVSDLPRKNNASPNTFPDRGYLDYIPNQQMTQGIRERVSAVISITEADLERVRASVFGGSKGAISTEEIDISQSMTARLTGSNSLQIQEISTPEQLIRAGEATQWLWDVTPTEDGDAQLYLILSVRARSADGFPSAKDLKPLIRTIHVKVDRVFKLQKFFKDNLAVIVGLLSIVTTLAQVPWSRFWQWLIGLSFIRRLQRSLHFRNIRSKFRRPRR
jgi:hypothetical protein